MNRQNVQIKRNVKSLRSNAKHFTSDKIKQIRRLEGESIQFPYFKNGLNLDVLHKSCQE